MRILVCGSRDWTNRDRIKQVLMGFPKATLVIHGGCRGADRLAGEVAVELEIPVSVYPAQWSKYGQSAGPIRNKQMLKEGFPDLVLVFHNDVFRSRGSASMVRLAEKAGVPTVVKKEQ